MKYIAMFSLQGCMDSFHNHGYNYTMGQKVYILELAKALALHGHQVDIYSCTFEATQKAESVCEGVKVIHIPCNLNDINHEEKHSTVLDEMVEKMIIFLREHMLSYDIYHSHCWDAGYVAMQLTEKLGCWFVHTPCFWEARKKGQLDDIPLGKEESLCFEERIEQEKIVIQASRGIILTSPEEREMYRRLSNHRSENVLMIPPGIDVMTYRPLQENEKERETGLPANYILSSAAIDHQKGFDVLLEAFALIANKYPDLFLVIGGGLQKSALAETEIKKELLELARGYRVSDRVIFSGYIPEEMMPSVYRGAHLFVLLSHFEYCEMKALEAMACGTPVVAALQNGGSSLSEYGIELQVLDLRDEEELPLTMDRIMEDEAFREELKESGLRKVYEAFSWEAIAQKHIDFYQSLQ